MNSYRKFAKPTQTTARPPLQSKRLLDQMRERLRYMHYSLSTEKTYLYWVRWYIRFNGLRHPREMGQSEVGFWGQSPNSPSLAARPQGAVLCTAVKLASDPNNPAAGGTSSPLDALLAGV